MTFKRWKNKRAFDIAVARRYFFKRYRYMVVLKEITLVSNSLENVKKLFAYYMERGYHHKDKKRGVTPVFMWTSIIGYFVGNDRNTVWEDRWKNSQLTSMRLRERESEEETYDISEDL